LSEVVVDQQVYAKKPSVFRRAAIIYKKRGLRSLLRNTALSLVSVYINFLDRKKLSGTERCVVREINGSTMYLDIVDEGLSRDLIVDGVREPHILETMKRELHEGDVVVDIGGNIGYYALLEAKIVGEKGRVYAIEPVQENIDLLKKNIELNAYSNIEVYQLAIGDRSGVFPIYVGRARNHSTLRQVDSLIENGGISYETTTEVIPLDDFLQDRMYPNIIRMDLEGYECQIVKGMEKTLAKNLPLTLFIEFHFDILKKEESVELLQILKKSGFEIIDITWEPRIRGRAHKFWWNIACSIQRKDHANVHLGHFCLSIDAVLSNTAILEGKCGALEIFFKRPVPLINSITG